MVYDIFLFCLLKLLMLSLKNEWQKQMICPLINRFFRVTCDSSAAMYVFLSGKRRFPLMVLGDSNLYFRFRSTIQFLPLWLMDDKAEAEIKTALAKYHQKCVSKLSVKLEYLLFCNLDDDDLPICVKNETRKPVGFMQSCGFVYYENKASICFAYLFILH